MATLVLFVTVVLGPASVEAEDGGNREPRTIVALWDGRHAEDVRDTRIHRLAEMPLEYLGLRLVYHDVSLGLPDVSGNDDLRGVVTWFLEGGPDDRGTYYRWASDLLDSGVRFAVLGTIAGNSAETAPAERQEEEGFLRRLGLVDRGIYVSAPWQTSFPVVDTAMVGFERDFTILPSSYHVYQAIDSVDTVRHLSADPGRAGQPKADLVITSAGGGFAQAGYAMWMGERDSDRRWIVNPFAFFAKAFVTHGLPKPDPTTLSGRRIYYSHIDGDGWRSLSRVPGYADHPTPAAEVILREAIEPYPDLPVTVAPIGADLDPDWYGTEEARRIAREALALPHVEAAHHTFTHPFAWGFYEDHDPELETRLVRRRAKGGEAGSYARRELEDGEEDPLLGYTVPRAFLDRPFDLRQEILGTADVVADLSPSDKPVALVQWSGNVRPFEDAITLARANGILNINGGDSRFDDEYPSVAFVPPVGAPVGEERQIYASNSNENTYTDLWTDRFFGFRYLSETIERTETPRRLRPFNVYYHMYSGERSAALDALIANLDLARASEIIPVTTTRYVRIAHGFYDTDLVRLAPRRWRIENRGELQTVRFDESAGLGVDYAGSHGVIGERRLDDRLFIALDAAHPAPTIVLSTEPRSGPGPAALVEARWMVRDLQRRDDGFSFTTEGFGDGAMTWRVPDSGPWSVAASRDGHILAEMTTEADGTGILSFVLTVNAIEPIEVEVTPARHRAGTK